MDKKQDNDFGYTSIRLASPFVGYDASCCCCMLLFLWKDKIVAQKNCIGQKVDSLCLNA